MSFVLRLRELLGSVVGGNCIVSISDLHDANSTMRSSDMWVAVFLLTTWTMAPGPAVAQTRSTSAVVAQRVLDAPESRLDYLDAAIAFDRLIDEDSDAAASRASVARVVGA